MSELTRKKNESSEIMFAMVDSTTPANLKSGLTVTDTPYYKDGAGAWTALSIADASTEIGSTGMYTIEMTAAELNHDLILIKLTSTGAADTIVIIRTTTHDIDDVNIVVPDAAGVAPTAAEIKTEIEQSGSSIASILEDTGDLQSNQGAWATATGFSPPNEYDTVIAALQTDLDDPTQYKATGFSTHSAADVWAVGTRALTDKAGFALLATGADLILKDSLFALAIADAIWDEILTGATHNIATSAGRRLREASGTMVLRSEETAQAGAAGSITLAAAASAIDHFYDKATIIITGGTGVGQARTIAEYVGSTKVATVCENWATTPDNTSVYVIRGHTCCSVFNINTDALAQINTECDTALTDYDPPTRAEATTDKNAIITEVDANETKISTVDGIVDAILVDTGTTLENHLVDIKGTGFVKDTDSLPQCLTATEFATATVCTEARLAELDAANIPTDLSTIDTIVDGVQTDLNNTTDGLGALKALIDTIDGIVDNILVDTGTTLENHFTDIKGTGFVKDTDSLPQCLTATEFATATVCTEARLAELDAANLPTDVANIEADTQDLQTQIGTAGAGLDDLGGMSVSMMGEVQTKVNDAMTALNLDHLIKDPVDTSFANTVHLDSAIGHMMGVGGSATFSRTTDSQEAIRNRGDDAWATGGAGSISEILNVQALIPNSIDLANTATVHIALGLVNTVDDLPSTAEITPGTITIDHKAIGATSWDNVVNAAACSELAGLVYYDEVFDATTGYAAGDSIRITFKSQKITVDTNDFEITGADGWTFQTHIREAMRGTDLAALAATWTDEKAAFLDHSIATAQADLDMITGSDGVTLAAQQLNYAPNTIIPDAMGTAAGLHATTNGKVDAVQTDATAIKAKTDALPSGITKNVALSGFNTFMVLLSDHVSAGIGKTVTGTVSKDGGVFNALANSVTEIGSGMYKVDLTQSEMDANVVTLKFVAADCDVRIITIYTS